LLSAAGLSTYLATLAYHQKHQVKSLKVLSCQVTPISADERKLSYKAENILKEQVMLEVTEFYDSFCYHPLYSFTITLEIKGLFWTKNTEKVSFGIYDMPDNLLRDIKEFSSSHSFTEYYDDLFSDIGEYFLPIDGTSHREDEVYAKSLEKFTTDLTQRTTSSFGVFGKYCEPNSIIISKSKRGTMAVIRNHQEWQPFGLIEPLY